jgi:hypothetical protein
MFGSIGLALGAVSTISSLLESATANISKAAAGNQLPATDQTFSPSPLAAAHSSAVPKNPGVVIPKFDERTQAALLALQEQHRGA